MKNVSQEDGFTVGQIKALEEKIGQRIRQRRIEMGMTQQDLAEKLNLSYQQIQKCETGLNRISAGRLYLVAQILMTNLDYFFNFKSLTEEPLPRARASTLAISAQSLKPEVKTALANLVRVLDQAK